MRDSREQHINRGCSRQIGVAAALVTALSPAFATAAVADWLGTDHVSQGAQNGNGAFLVEWVGHSENAARVFFETEEKLAATEVTEDFEMESRFSSVARTIFRGREGVVAWWGDLAEAWEWMDLQFQDCADVAADRTMILWTLRGLGQGSGLRLDEAVAQRWYWRGERLAKIEYLDRLEAEGIVRGQQQA